jgi:hypothetical protein
VLSSLFEVIELIGETLTVIVRWRARRGRRVWPIVAGIALVVTAAVLFLVYG